MTKLLPNIRRRSNTIQLLHFCTTFWGTVLEKEGKHDEAIAKFQKAIELDPTYSIPYNDSGTYLENQGKRFASY